MRFGRLVGTLLFRSPIWGGLIRAGLSVEVADPIESASGWLSAKALQPPE